MLLWVHECESIQVASCVELKKAVKEYSRTFSAGSIVIVKQLAQVIILGANVGRVKAKQLHDQELYSTCFIQIILVELDF